MRTLLPTRRLAPTRRDESREALLRATEAATTLGLEPQSAAAPTAPAAASTFLDHSLQPAPIRTIRVELLGNQMRASAMLDIGRFGRLNDYVNILDGFFQLSNVTLLTRTGAPTRVMLAELRMRLDEVILVGQKELAGVTGQSERRIEKQPRRLVVMTTAHVIYGFAYLHRDASLTAFVDSPDPRFIPMTNVRVRWLADRRLAGRYPFALLQRRHIIGVATETDGRKVAT